MGFGIIMAMLFVAAIIAVTVILGVRSSGGGGKRIVGPPTPGDEPTQHERDLAMRNLPTMNQQETLREAQRSFGS